MKLYKYRSLERMDHALEIIVKGRLYCPKYSDLNDPFEGLFIKMIPGRVNQWKPVNTWGQRTPASVDDIMTSSIHKRVCSLSSDLKDVRLWSHYANSHKGIAIEIDFTDHMDDVLKVEYSHKLLELDDTLSAIIADPKQVLTRKTDHWVYESEYRIITDKEYYPVRGMVNAIFCGINMPDLHREILQATTSPYGIDIIETELDIENVRIVEKYKKQPILP